MKIRIFGKIALVSIVPLAFLLIQTCVVISQQYTDYRVASGMSVNISLFESCSKLINVIQAEREYAVNAAVGGRSGGLETEV